MQRKARATPRTSVLPLLPQTSSAELEKQSARSVVQTRRNLRAERWRLHCSWCSCWPCQSKDQARRGACAGRTRRRRRCRRRWTTRVGTARTAPRCSRTGVATAPIRWWGTAPTRSTATSKGTARPRAPPATSAAPPRSPPQTPAPEPASTLQLQVLQGRAPEPARAPEPTLLPQARHPQLRPAWVGASLHQSARPALRRSPQRTAKLLLLLLRLLASVLS